MFAGLVLLFAMGAADPPVLPEESEILGMTEEMKAFVDARVHPRTPAVERMWQIVRLIFDDNGLGFQYDKSRTKTAAETFRDGSGNCLSFTLLFMALARHVGLDVSFQQVEVPPSWDKHGEIIVATQHINAVVDIDGRRYEVDLAASVSRLRLGAHVVSDENGLANFYSNRAVDYLGGGDAETALQYVERAIRTDPEAGFAWSNRGVIQSGMGLLPEAEKSYLHALRLDRDRLGTLDNLMKLYRKMGKHGQAEKYRKKVAKYRNKNPFYHYHLGMLALESKDPGRAVQHFRAAIKRRSRDDTFHFALARAYVQQGEWDLARESLLAAQKYARDPAREDRYDAKLRWLQLRREGLSTQASIH